MIFINFLNPPSHRGHLLKVPKREIFVTELFILSDPIWVGDLRTEPIKPSTPTEWALKIIHKSYWVDGRAGWQILEVISRLLSMR